MSILEKTIAKLWFSFLARAVCVLGLLASLATLVEGLLRSTVTPLEVVYSYLIGLPSMFSQILPVSSLAATLFLITSLKNRNELVAIFSLGLSRKRFISIILVLSFFIGVMNFFLLGYLGPKVKVLRNDLLKENVHRFSGMKEQGLKAKTMNSGQVWYKSGNYFMAFNAFSQNTLYDLSLYYMASSSLEGIRLEKKVWAKYARHLKDTEWEFFQGIEYSELNSQLFPKEEKFEKRIYFIDESPEAFSQIEADTGLLTFRSLHAYIQKLHEAGININEFIVFFYAIVAQGLICMVFACLPLVSIFNVNRRTATIGKNFAFIFIFILAYMLANSYALELGRSGVVNPFLACFSAIFAFTFYLCFFFYRHRYLR